MRMVLTNKKTARELASKVKSLKSVSWKLSDVRPEIPLPKGLPENNKPPSLPPHSHQGREAHSKSTNSTSRPAAQGVGQTFPAFPPPPNPFLSLNPWLPALMAALGVPPPPPHLLPIQVPVSSPRPLPLAPPMRVSG